jgi:enoyl-CoA hydratase/carnithine racemase
MKKRFGDHVHIAVEGYVAVVTLSRAPHNFVSTAFMSDLADAIAEADADPSIRAVVLQADGKSFCAGADFSAPSEEILPKGAEIPPLYEQAVRLYSARKPIIAAIQGAAVGAGLGLALVADFRIASAAARFVANFVKLAFHPGFGISLALPRLIGEQKAALMLLTGRRISGDEAFAWGLADQLVAADDLRPAALRLATEIAEGGPLAIIAIRATLRAGLAEAIRKRAVLEFREQLTLQASEDFSEGIRSVAERRPGNFKGL